LRGEIEVAQRAERTPREYQKVMRSALEEIERLTVMSEDMLLITRADARLLSPHPRPTDLNALVAHVLEAFQDRVAEKELTIEGPGPGGSSSASVDPGLVETLVQHLVDNAVKFTPPGGRITITTVPESGHVRLSVQDSGPGIAPEDLPHIFEPFYRADPARTRGTGIGLGLALVAAVARLHGGTARASNHNGSGARLEVDFPAVTPV
jgi:two-component system, OmpR family, sensor kinase